AETAASGSRDTSKAQARQQQQARQQRETSSARLVAALPDVSEGNDRKYFAQFRFIGAIKPVWKLLSKKHADD
ncbi:MAG: hypothetical protein ACXWGY_04325, partial [Chthoniobacterales bacterium]